MNKPLSERFLDAKAVALDIVTWPIRFPQVIYQNYRTGENGEEKPASPVKSFLKTSFEQALMLTPGIAGFGESPMAGVATLAVSHLVFSLAAATMYDIEDVCPRATKRLSDSKAQTCELAA